MRARVALVVAASALFAALPLGSDPGLAVGDPGTSSTTSTTVESQPDPSTTTSSTAPPVTAPPALAGAPATRGSIVQLTPTLPPPTTAPPPPPPPGPYDLPWFSGEGRRVVYSKGRQRVWVIDGSNTIIRTYLVSGRLSQPNIGTYSVFSRSSYTCNIDRYWVCMRWMIRFTKGPEGDNIGFHEIPKNDGVWVQSEAQLGQPLSGGCVRQGTDDAWFLWNWAGIGTKVVVTA